MKSFSHYVNSAVSPFVDTYKAHIGRKVRGLSVETSALRATAEREFGKFRVVDFFYRDPWFYSVVNAVASSISQVPVGIYIELADMKRHYITDHKQINDFLMQPNPIQTWSDFFYLSSLNLETNGNLFWAYNLGPGGLPEVYVLRSSNVEISRTPAGDRMYKYVPQNSTNPNTVVFFENEIIHTMNFDPMDDFRGMSPMQPALYDLVVSFLARTYNMAFIENGARPSGFVSVDKELDDVGLRRLKEQMFELLQGPKRAGAVGYLAKGESFESVQLTPKDMEFLNLIKASRESILSVMRIPPVIVGVFEFANYANSEIQKKLFWEEGLLPRVAKLENSMTRLLRRLFNGDIRFGFRTETVQALQPNQVELAQVISSLLNGAISIMTINEARAKFGLDPVDPEIGDQLFSQGTAMLLEDAIDPTNTFAFDEPTEDDLFLRDEDENESKPRIIQARRRRLITPINAA